MPGNLKEQPACHIVLDKYKYNKRKLTAVTGQDHVGHCR